MSINTWLSVRCDDCGLIAGGADDMRPTGSAARMRARGLGYVTRPHPETGKRIDLCANCAKDPIYHQVSELNVAANLRKFEAEIANAATNQESRYWAHLQGLFVESVRHNRLRPFSDFKAMYEEEFC